jgi:glycosyltransferase involved in cell wall biosynthesis
MLSAENTPLVVPQDEAALADAIARALEDPALRRSAGTANRRKAEREFDERTMVDRYSRLFAGLG